MKLEDQVCSLELSKSLKELGVKQESYFYWNEIDDNNEEGAPFTRCELLNYGLNSSYAWSFSAFTVSELGEILPIFSTGYNELSITKSHVTGWKVEYGSSRTSDCEFS